MRLLIALFIISTYSYPNSLSYEEIAQMVAKIKKRRSGIGIDKLNGTPNPFAIVKRVVKKPKKRVIEKKIPEVVKIVEPTYTLTAILNSRAFINGKWYGLQDKVGDYRVVYIGDTTVVMRRSGAVKRLKISTDMKEIDLFHGDKQ